MIENIDIEGVKEILNSVIKIGEVSSVDYAKGTARVVFDDDDNIVSYDLQVLHINTLKNKDFAMPDIGEDVVCLFLPSGVEEGFILGSVYAGEIAPPESSGDKRTVVFADDTRISYDRATHQLDISILETTITANRENIIVNTPKNTEITTGADLKATVGGNATATVTGNATITAAGNADVSASGACSITAPTITLNGNIILNGAVSATGVLAVAGAISTPADVTAGQISLLAHTHTGNLGSPTSPPNA